MTHEELGAALYEKAAAEQQKYRDSLYAMPTQEALGHAFEYSTRENILMALGDIELEDSQAEMLLASSTPLSDIFHHYDNHDFTLMKGVRKCVVELADDMLTAQRNLPVYKYPGDHARESGEMEQYRASYKANVACAEAIDKAIASRHDGFSFDSKAAVKEVVERFGYDRTLFVLAATVQNQEWDGRFSNNNKDWARTVPVFDTKRSREYSVRSHPVLADAFVATARHEHLLSLPLTKEDIKAEALKILSKFQNTQEPNSPNGTHFTAQISPDFLARANTKATDRLMSMLPFQTLSFSKLEGREGTFALISKDENRFQKLVLRKPSVRRKLQEKSATAKPPTAGKKKEQER